MLPRHPTVRLIAIDPSPIARKNALALGATHAIDPSDGKAKERVYDILPDGPDLVVRAVARRELGAARRAGAVEGTPDDGLAARHAVASLRRCQRETADPRAPARAITRPAPRSSVRA